MPPLLAYHLGGVLTRGTVVDLFSGAGGMSLGLEWAGFDLLAAVDNDANCLSNFPGEQTPEITRALSQISLTLRHYGLS